MTDAPSIEELLPQRPPMVLISGYRPGTPEEVAEAWVDVTPSSPFYEEELGGVPPCVALEYMAQTMALCIGMRRRRMGLAPKLGFVLGSRRLTTSLPFFRNGGRYDVRSVCTYQDESFGSFDCRVSDPSGRTVAEAVMTAFQPEGDLTPEALEAFA